MKVNRIVLWLVMLASFGILSQASAATHLAFGQPVRSGFMVGTAVQTNYLNNEPAYAQTVVREFNTLMPEYEMKFWPLSTARGQYDFSRADALVNFAQNNNMYFRAHALIWHESLPGWLTSRSWTRDELIQIMREHITTVVTRYRGRIPIWDVVNEAIDENGNLRNTIYLQTIGPDYIDLAFRFAREADPNVKLYYNDYGTEGSGAKSDAVYNLVRGLIQRGVPINGVGLQMHLGLAWSPSAQDVTNNMARLAALGLDIQITEMDVRTLNGSGTTQQRFEAQAVLYQRMLDVCLLQPRCTGFSVWGVTDKYTWLRGENPLLFDANYQPKPAYTALRNRLASGNNQVPTPVPTTVPPTVVVPTQPSFVVESRRHSTNTSQIEVAIKLARVQNIYGMEATCQVDPASLAGASRTDGNGFSAQNSLIVDRGFEAASGRWLVALSRMAPNPAVSGDVTAFTLTYNVRQWTNTTVNCTLRAVNPDGQDVSLATVVNNLIGSPNPTSAAPTATIVPMTLVPGTPVVVPTSTRIAPTATPVVGASATPGTGQCSTRGNLFRETWTNVPGWSIAELTGNAAYPSRPTGSGLVANFEIPQNQPAVEAFGARYRGYLCPQTTGNYNFWIAANDAAHLLLSTDANPANARRIAAVDTWTSYQNWTQYPVQASAAIALTAGRAYYVEVIFKQGAGGHHLSVAWQGPSIQRQVIQGSFLSASGFGGGSPAPQPTLVATATVPVAISPTPLPTGAPPQGTPVSPGTLNTITGSVTYQARTNHVGIVVELLNGSTVAAQATTDTAGQFRLTDIANGTYSIRARATNYLALWQNIQINSQSLNATLSRLIAGDTDSNGAIELADAGLVGANYALRTPTAPQAADVNADGLVGLTDLTLIGSNFGQRAPTAPSGNAPVTVVGGSTSPAAVTFGQDIVLQEVSSASQSNSPTWWLTSGALFTIQGGVGRTLQGRLPDNDPQRLRYAQYNSEHSGGGYYPQNIFRLVTRQSFRNTRQMVNFWMSAYNPLATTDRDASDGVLFFTGYQNEDNLYYAGLRVDGQVVIKKKINGNYYTLAIAPVISGTYNRTSNPNLIPTGRWIGMRTDTITNADGSVTINVYLDLNNTGTYTLALTATDRNGAYGGAPFSNGGMGGIRSDYMDLTFSNYQLIQLP